MVCILSRVRVQLVASSSIRPKNKVKAIQIIPVVIIIVSVFGALYFNGFLDSFISNQNSTGLTSDGGKLSPTRDVEGTWKTTFPTQFVIATDYESFGQLSDVGTEDRTMIWTITPTSDVSVVVVNIQFTYSNRQLISGSGYTPDVSPMQLRGVINGTQLTLFNGNAGPIEQIGSVGVFTFTSTQMEGTWHDHWNGAYEQNVYTATDGLKLMKQ
jgi:hypothetical protein